MLVTTIGMMAALPASIALSAYLSEASHGEFPIRRLEDIRA
jgi:hypothetical protein